MNGISIKGNHDERVYADQGGPLPDWPISAKLDFNYGNRDGMTLKFRNRDEKVNRPWPAGGGQQGTVGSGKLSRGRRLSGGMEGRNSGAVE